MVPGCGTGLALYTVEGRQAGDLPQKCGNELLRSAKLPRDRVEVVPFAGRAGALSARRHEGGGHASHPGGR